MLSLFVHENDIFYMRRALKLAAKARGRTSPNPMVGAVLVKDGRVIAGDYHRKAGSPHAEALVLEAAGPEAKGSTLYVTLEPCSHTDKRTPPCTQAIIKAGVKSVVAAMKDPNPKVSGEGFRLLQEAGVEVNSGVLEKEAAALNEAYTKFITTGRPFVILKAAMTLDGKIATPEGQSKWITGEKSRRLVHAVRGSVDAVLTAIGTVKADNPELTSRIKGGRDPIRVVIDPELEIPEDSKLLKTLPQTIIATKTQNEKCEKLIKSGIDVLFFQAKLELDMLLAKLADRGITSVLIEGGSSLNARALHAGVVDKVMFFIAPKIIGGRDSFPVVGGRLYRQLDEAYMIENTKIRRIGEDFLVEGYVKKA